MPVPTVGALIPQQRLEGKKVSFGEEPLLPSAHSFQTFLMHPRLWITYKYQIFLYSIVNVIESSAKSSGRDWGPGTPYTCGAPIRLGVTSGWQLPNVASIFRQFHQHKCPKQKRLVYNKTRSSLFSNMHKGVCSSIAQNRTR